MHPVSNQWQYTNKRSLKGSSTVKWSTECLIEKWCYIINKQKIHQIYYRYRILSCGNQIWRVRVYKRLMKQISLYIISKEIYACIIRMSHCFQMIRSILKSIHPDGPYIHTRSVFFCNSNGGTLERKHIFDLWHIWPSSPSSWSIVDHVRNWDTILHYIYLTELSSNRATNPEQNWTSFSWLSEE